MAIASTVFVKKLHLAAAQFATLFRVNTGSGWVGAKAYKVLDSGPHYVEAGDMIIKKPRPFRAGLTNGGGDLIGWRTRLITDDMVGLKIAQFVSIEGKYKTGRASKDQLNFIKQLTQAGGIAGVARSEEEAIKMVK